MLIAFYRGTSLFSRLIRFFCWFAKHSHASFINRIGMEYEAWQFKSYQCVKFGANHTKGTVVDLYRIKDLSDTQSFQVENIFKCFVMKKVKYDYIGCTRFLTHINRGNDKKLFCSEGIVTAFNAIRYYFFKDIEPWKVSPAMLATSPQLEYIATIKVGDDITPYLKN